MVVRKGSGNASGFDKLNHRDGANRRDGAKQFAGAGRERSGRNYGSDDGMSYNPFAALLK